MMDDDEEKPGVTQIPLMHDLVFDSSLPLKPPKRKASAPRKPKNYSPDYDPDTIDLFGDISLPGDDKQARNDNAPLASDASEVVDTESDHSIEIEDNNAAPQISPDPIDPSLRGELTDQLSSILDDLADRKPD